VLALNEAGWRVRALVRRDAPDLAAELVRGDLDDTAALAALCDGADAVFHAAGVVKARRPADFQAANATGARRVAEAAQGAGRVVLVSSLTAREPQLSPYAASKRAGEAAMAEVLGERLSIARPPAIYGPADRELLPVFLAAQASPVLPTFDSRARIAMIHVEDAARQIAALATLPGPIVTALSDERPDGYSWRELMGTAAAAVGRPARFASTPGFVVHGLGLANDLARVFGATPMLTSGKARELMHRNWALAPEERSPGLPAARYSLAEGFAHTVAWYRTAAWMKQ
jgi:nucleoside-diphosphate-sugar epimerase